MNRNYLFLLLLILVCVVPAQQSQADPGCTDPLAYNYEADATEDDGTCLYVGCADNTYLEFYTQGFVADFGDNSFCETILIPGCTDSTACNYDISANWDGENCLYLDGVCQTCEDGEVVNNDADNDGICDNLEVVCDVILNPPSISDDNCDGVWEIYFDFQYVSEVPGLEDIEAIFDPDPGFVELAVDPDVLYDLSYSIDVPGEYTVSFQSSSECSNNFLEVFPIVAFEDVDVSYVLDPNICQDGLGSISGSIDGPSGIYDIYIDGQLQTSVSTGLDNILFDAVWNGNQSSNCESDVFTSPCNQSVALFVGSDGDNNFSELENGDQIGAFYSHPTCGLTNAGSIVFNGVTDNISVWGDELGTSVIEGLGQDQPITWLLKKVSDDVIYNIDITWNDILPSADTWTCNGTSAIIAIDIQEPYDDITTYLHLF